MFGDYRGRFGADFLGSSGYRVLGEYSNVTFYAPYRRRYVLIDSVARVPQGKKHFMQCCGGSRVIAEETTGEMPH